MKHENEKSFEHIDRKGPYPWMLHAVVNGMKCECCGEEKYRRFISVEMYKYFSFLAGRSIDHRLC